MNVMFGMSGFISGFSILIAASLVIGGMIFLYLKVVPKKYDGTFKSKLLQGVHDYFNFKNLYLETVIKFLFTLLTLVCVAVGVAGLVATFMGFFRDMGYLVDDYISFGQVLGNFLAGMFGGILTIVVGPIVVRLIYEGILMFILLVQNVIDIRNKMMKPEATIKEDAE